MRLPELTHLQYLVLSFLLDGERTGSELRTELAKAKQKRSDPAFYLFMSRMEEANFVEGRYEVEVIDGMPLKFRRYRITAHGIKACERTQAFYASPLVGRLVPA